MINKSQRSLTIRHNKRRKFAYENIFNVNEHILTLKREIKLKENIYLTNIIKLFYKNNKKPYSLNDVAGDLVP
jgi:hypothetical protein